MFKHTQAILLRSYKRWCHKRIPASQIVTLNQRSIFVVPSREGWIFMLALSAMFIGGVNYENSLILALTFCLTGLFLVAIVHTFRNLSGVILTCTLTEPGFVDDFVMYQICVSSDTTIIHESIELGLQGLGLHPCAIKPGQATTIKLFVPAQQRGLQRPGRLRIQTVFPVGLVKAWSLVDLSLEGTVYPKIIPGPAPIEEQYNHDLPQSNALPGYDDFASLQPYQAGDNLSRVYWKVAARGLPLATKAFETPFSDACWLSYDPVNGHLERQLSVLTYWVLKKSEAQLPFGLDLPGRRIAINQGVEHKQACLQALAFVGQDQSKSDQWDLDQLRGP